MNRAILHVDMDAFFASVEILDNPALAGLPVVVGVDGQRGVVAAASYAVRAFGVHSAMPMRDAWRRCPQLVVVRPRMERYKELSRQVFALFREVTPLVEGLSVDEAFLDVTASRQLLGDELTIARTLKQRIHAVTGLTASIGIAPNKLVAKIASDLDKPDGLTHVPPERVQAVLDPLPVGKLWGLGAKTLPRVQAAGLHTFRDLRMASDATLWAVFGRSAVSMRARASGEDERAVEPNWQELQVSAEETFGQDTKDPTALHAALTALADRACSRLRAKGWEAGTVTVKLRRSDFRTFTRQLTFSPPTADTQAVLHVARRLFTAWHQEQGFPAVRLLGIGLGGLVPATQLDLLASRPTSDHAAKPGVGHAPAEATALTGASALVRGSTDGVVDAIRAKFGTSAVRRANVLERPQERADGFTEVRRKD